MRPRRGYVRREALQIDLQRERGTSEIVADSAGFPNQGHSWASITDGHTEEAEETFT